MQLGMLNGGVHLFGNGGMTSSVHSDADIAATVDAFGERSRRWQRTAPTNIQRRPIAVGRIRLAYVYGPVFAYNRATPFGSISMKHTRLGRTGLQVSRLCLGTMTFGLQCDEQTSRRDHGQCRRGRHHVLRHRRRLSARRRPARTVGRTEEIVGRWLKGRRDAVHPRHQVLRPHRARARGTRATRASTSSTRSTLRCGGCRPTTSTSTSCTAPTPKRRSTRRCGALDDLVRSGKVRYVGCSNFLAYQVARAIGRSEALGVVRFDSVQPRYNLLFREIERELLPLCARGGHRRHPVQPDRRRPAQRQAQRRAADPRRAPGSRSARPPSATRTGTGTRACSKRSSSCVRSRPAPACRSRRWRSPGCWPTRRSRRRSSAPAGRSSSNDTLQAAETPLPARLKAELDELDGDVPPRRRSPVTAGATTCTSSWRSLARRGCDRGRSDHAALRVRT